ncbi:hypothetical protein GOBAR_DD14420 [Gossypium barbadense]|nr:hypothetical protein GOBAR_DD14420 [Gossypium barbadense]
MAPPPMNTMEQLLAVQNAISQAEQLVQDGNIVLLKFRALLLSILPQARDRFATLLVFTALVLALVPNVYEVFAPRKASTERWMRRLREWWFNIPAAPVVIETQTERKG